MNINNNLKLIMTKVGKALTFVSLLFGFHGISSSRQAKLASLMQEDQLKRLELAQIEANRLTKELVQNSTDTIVKNQNVLNNVNNLTVKASENLDSISQTKGVIDHLVEKLNDPNLDEAQRELIIGIYNKTVKSQADSLEKANSTLKEILEVVKPSINSPNELTIIEKITDIINQITNFFDNVLENIKVLVSTLNIEQLIAFINACGQVFIFSCLISVGATLYSDYLLTYFKLETKYPRVAKYIELRRKFQRYYLNINFLGAILMLLFLFSFNIHAIFFAP